MTGVHQAQGGNDALGYRDGFGSVTQLTDKTTAVEINALSGQITIDDASLAAAGEATFTVNNSLVAATDVPVVVVQDQGATGEIVAFVTDVADGSFDVTIANLHATTAHTSAGVLNFAVLKVTGP